MTTIDAVARMTRLVPKHALARGLQWWTLSLVILLAAPAWAQTMTFPVQMRWITNTVFYGSNTTAQFWYEHSFLTPEEACTFQGAMDPSTVGAVPGPLEWSNVDSAMVHPCIAHRETVNYSAGRTWEMPYCPALPTWGSTCEVTCPAPREASQCSVAAMSPGVPARPVEVSPMSRARRAGSIAAPKNPVSST